MIALIDYGAGNLTSVKKALAAIGAEVFTPRRPEDIAPAQGVIVPGVGHFGATNSLDQRWMDAILERGRERGATVADIGVLIGNDPAQRAYEKFGFQVVEDLRDAEFEAAYGSPGARMLRRAL